MMIDSFKERDLTQAEKLSLLCAPFALCFIFLVIVTGFMKGKDQVNIGSVPVCEIHNTSTSELNVKILKSKLTAGTYYLKPKQQGIFFCGDHVRIGIKNKVSDIVLANSVNVSIDVKNPE